MAQKLLVLAVFTGAVIGFSAQFVRSQEGECFAGLGDRIEHSRCKKKGIASQFPPGGKKTKKTPEAPPAGKLPPPGGSLPRHLIPGSGDNSNSGVPPVVPDQSVPPAQNPETRRFVVYENFDLFGGDYARSKQGVRFSERECVDTCRSESTCIAFTYNARHGVCFLKDELPTILKPFSGAVSGVVNTLPQPPRQAAPVRDTRVQDKHVTPSGACGGGYRTFWNVDFVANDIGGWRGSLSSCRRRCNNMADCAGFSWIKSRRISKRCWIKFAVGRTKRNSGVFSCAK